MKKLLFLLTLTFVLAGCHLMRMHTPLPSPDPATLPQAGEYLHSSPQPDFVQKQVDQFREDNKTRQPGGIVFCGRLDHRGLSVSNAILPDYQSPIGHRRRFDLGPDPPTGCFSAYELRPAPVVSS
jgi:hypothetical protein